MHLEAKKSRKRYSELKLREGMLNLDNNNYNVYLEMRHERNLQIAHEKEMRQFGNNIYN